MANRIANPTNEKSLIRERMQSLWNGGTLMVWSDVIDTFSPVGFGAEERTQTPIKYYDEREHANENRTEQQNSSSVKVSRKNTMPPHGT